MKIRTPLLVAGLLAGSAAAAWAQTQPGSDCITLPQTPSGCARNDISIQLLINSNVISGVVANGFGMGPTNVTPAGVAGLTPEEGAERLADRGPATILPTSDETASPS